MAHILIDPEAQLDTLATLLSEAGQLLDKSAVVRFEGRRRELAALLAGEDPNPFDFGLARDKPIRTSPSSEHKGVGNEAGQVLANVTFNWTIRRSAVSESTFEVIRGGTDVEFLSATGHTLRKFHYDVCRGGIDERGGTAHHPFAHFQYKDGYFADLPRIPTLVFTPADVLEQVFLDLWPTTWPNLSRKVGARAALHKHHAAQRARVKTSALRFVESATRAALPLRGLQDKLTDDLAI